MSIDIGVIKKTLTFAAAIHWLKKLGKGRGCGPDCPEAPWPYRQGSRAKPDLLICDERTTVLDEAAQAESLTRIRCLRADLGMGVLFISHDLDVMAEIANRVVVLRNGVCEGRGLLTPIFAKSAAEYLRLLVAATPKPGRGVPKPLRNPDPILRVKTFSARFLVQRSFWPCKNCAYHAVARASLTVGNGETPGLILGLIDESDRGNPPLPAPSCA